jgi:hypothetical protein
MWWVRKQTLALVMAFSAVLASACSGERTEQTGRGTDGGAGAASGGTGGTGGTGGGLAGSSSAGTGGAGAAPPSCDDPAPGRGSCSTFSDCVEGTSSSASSAILMTCLSAEGRFASTEPCSDFQMTGRCFEPSRDAWHVHYGLHGEALASEESTCETLDGLWCWNPAGVEVEVALACKNACDAARPDYTAAPECFDSDTCFNDCLDAVEARGDGCFECVASSIDWPPGGCNDFECQCPPATFD